MLMRPEILIEASECIIDMPHRKCALWCGAGSSNVLCHRCETDPVATCTFGVLCAAGSPDISMYSGSWYQKDVLFSILSEAEYIISPFLWGRSKEARRDLVLMESLICDRRFSNVLVYHHDDTNPIKNPMFWIENWDAQR